MPNSWDRLTQVGALARLHQPGFSSDSYSRLQALAPLSQSLMDDAYIEQNSGPIKYDEIMDFLSKYPEGESILNALFDEGNKQKRFNTRMEQRGPGRWDTLRGLPIDTFKSIY